FRRVLFRSVVRGAEVGVNPFDFEPRYRTKSFEQVRHVVGQNANSSHAGVHLKMDLHGPALSCSGPGHGKVRHTGPQAILPVEVGGLRPQGRKDEDGSCDTRLSKHKGFFHQGDTEPFRARRESGPRDGYDAVTVRIGLDHGHEAYAAREEAPELVDIVANCVKIDLNPRGASRRTKIRGHGGPSSIPRK